MTDIVAMATVGNVEFVRCEELTTEISEVLARPKFENTLKNRYRHILHCTRK